MRKIKYIFTCIVLFLSSILQEQIYSQSSFNTNHEIIDQEISIHIEEDPSILKGFLTWRSDIKSGPPILLINGQQFADANLNNTGSPIYKDIARYFAENGFLVLRMHS